MFLFLALLVNFRFMDFLLVHPPQRETRFFDFERSRLSIFQGYRALRRDWEEPRESFYWSAHFSFSSSRVLREVPYDPRLLMLFFGEVPSKL